MGYRPGLDVVRALAVLAVIAYHYAGKARHLIPGGNLGVNVFFVLSGFLITRLLLEEHSRSDRVSIRSFVQRRAARLIPALLLLLTWIVAATFVLDVYADRGAVVRGIAATLFYVRNWMEVAGSSEPALGFAWTLSVEEQFYLVWPVVFVAAARRSRRAVVAVSVFLLSASVAQMMIRSIFFGVSDEALTYGTESSGLTGVMTGCVLAGILSVTPVASRRGRIMLQLAAVSASIVLLMFIFVLGNQPLLMPRGGHFAVAASTAIVLAGVVRGAVPFNRRMSAPLLWTGRHSYGLYLWHLPALVATSHFLPDTSAMGVRVFALVVTFATAAASMKWLEAPARRRLSPARPSEVVDLRAGLSGKAKHTLTEDVSHDLTGATGEFVAGAVRDLA
ncbi:MAG: acyltransferase [Acidimicrobiales bacterium]|nr:acyltransferase [Acidimicrobiales bacterium]